ncbi:MAG: glycosyltransferase [Bacteroidota bacterium]
MTDASGPQLLFLSSQLPYPPHKGGVGISWRMVKYFSQHFSTAVICVLKGEDPQHSEAFQQALSLHSFYGHPLDIGRSLVTVGKSYLQNRPINLVRNAHPHIGKKVSELAESGCVILVDHYEMFQYIQPGFANRTILHTHNAEYLMWQRYSELTESTLRRMAAKKESQRIYRQEKSYYSRADQVWAFPNDKVLIDEMTDGKAATEAMYPIGEDGLLAMPDLQWEDTEKSLLYVGTLSWEANADGLHHFLRKVWPQLLQSHPDLQFYIAGTGEDERLKVYEESPNIHFLGFVEDLEVYFKKCRVLVAPLRFGSGIKLKVFNTLMRGLPIVTTPVGAEGLPVQHGVHLMIGAQASGMARSIQLLLENASSWEQIRDQSRALARKELAATTQLERMRETISAFSQ